MQDAADEDLEYLKGLFDQRFDLAVGAWDDAQKTESVLSYDFKRLFEIVDRQLTLLNTREDEDAFELTFAPADAFRLLLIMKNQREIIAEGTTPREFYRLLKEMTETFPQAHALYVMSGGVSYAWLRTDLPEDDAILHMLTHDDAVRATLGLPAYDHSQW